MQNFTELIKKLSFRRTLFVVATLAILFITFSLGMFVGIEKAKFSYRWGENYFGNFVGQPGPFFDRNFINSHGVFGEIIKITDNSIIIKSKENVEISVIVSEETAIIDHDKNLIISDLTAGDNIIIIGSPDDKGQIEAKLIRVAPSLPGFPGHDFKN